MDVTAQKIWFDPEHIFALLNDGRIVGMPLAWFPRLQKASEQQREKFELFDNGKWIHWEQLNEDLSAAGFISFKK